MIVTTYLEITPSHDTFTLQSYPDLGLPNLSQVLQQRSQYCRLTQIIGSSTKLQLSRTHRMWMNGGIHIQEDFTRFQKPPWYRLEPFRIRLFFL